MKDSTISSASEADRLRTALAGIEKLGVLRKTPSLHRASSRYWEKLPSPIDCVPSEDLTYWRILRLGRAITWYQYLNEELF